MILEWLSTGHDSIPHPLAPYATTSEEWRVFFEQKTFRRLRVLPTCLDEFDRIVTGRRRPYVRHIWFRIELKSRGHGQSSKFLSEVNKMILTAGLLHLFDILADWLEGESNQKGLALELSAFSSIDPDHSMKDAVPRDIEDLDVWTDSDRSRAIYEGVPSEINRLSVSRSPEHDRIMHCMGTSQLGPFPATDLPEVRVITELCVRRQTYHPLFMASLRDIAEKLPRLRHLTYEPWRKWDDAGLMADAMLFCDVLDALPPTLRSLRIFEDYEGFHHGRSTPRICTAQPRHTHLPHLEVVSLSFLIDAIDFFTDYISACVLRHTWCEWDNLVSLTLTSNTIRSDASSKPQPINKLLLFAAIAAKDMPRLQVMEIYNGVGKGEGGIFRFAVANNCCSVTWESTWPFHLSQEVFEAWRMLAEKREARKFHVQVRQIPAQTMKWSNCILPLLQTRGEVAHPITYWNMMQGLNRL